MGARIQKARQNSRYVEAKFQNGVVDSLLVKGTEPLINGSIVWPPVIQNI